MCHNKNALVEEGNAKLPHKINFLRKNVELVFSGFCYAWDWVCDEMFLTEDYQRQNGLLSWSKSLAFPCHSFLDWCRILAFGGHNFICEERHLWTETTTSPDKRNRSSAWHDVIHRTLLRRVTWTWRWKMEANNIPKMWTSIATLLLLDTSKTMIRVMEVSSWFQCASFSDEDTVRPNWAACTMYEI